MRTGRNLGDIDGLSTLDGADTQVLSAAEERLLLREMGECKGKLAEALALLPGRDAPAGADAPQALAEFLRGAYAGDPRSEANLGAVYQRYAALRSRLALANLRLVAYVAKRFRDRGVAYSDLMQEGFCGLLEAIDRFDLTHQTKLSTYATWWIRQSMQRVVASCAYPVRLSPRHLRQLAQNQAGLEGSADPSALGGASSGELIRRIHAATRPTLSLDASFDSDGNFSLLQTISDSDGDPAADVDRDETIGKLLESLRAREQQVLALRFGLGGGPKLSLSQVGKVLEVSKERVRQIQVRALAKLRTVGDGDHRSSALGLDG